MEKIALGALDRKSTDKHLSTDIETLTSLESLANDANMAALAMFGRCVETKRVLGLYEVIWEFRSRRREAAQLSC
ncbi:hypothetical protein MFRU_011g01980 [Monilinia fructicola]|nr:hypothetical protein MFRU_011g01980 [Monilinia fructicola]